MSELPISEPLSLPPLSLYIHIPWCVRKCPYCDFNSHESQKIDEAAYIDTLIRDLAYEVTWLASRSSTRKLRSIFFGGGTPSLFSAEGIRRILSMVESYIEFEPDIEITLEANPGTFEQEKFSGFFQAGINRLSIGVQSFNEIQLKKLGRIHNGTEAQRAVNIAQKAGFTNINIDLMHGLPEQQVTDAEQDLQLAIDLGPQHISWYQLTIEPNTVFYRQPPPLPVEDVLADIQYHGGHLLSQHGFEQYEVSAFARDGQSSQHNMNYWQFGDYLGIGAGAHGKLTDIPNQQIIRRQKTRLPEHYMQGNTHPTYKENSVAHDELTLEFMMNALRLNRGVPSHYFSERTGLALAQVTAQLSKLQKQGLMENHQQRLVTTELGQRFLNTVLETFSEHW